MGGFKMKRKRYTEEQIIWILKEYGAGMSAQDVIREHGIESALTMIALSGCTFHAPQIKGVEPTAVPLTLVAGL